MDSNHESSYNNYDVNKNIMILLLCTNIIIKHLTIIG